jgi:hypothetical protein
MGSMTTSRTPALDHARSRVGSPGSDKYGIALILILGTIIFLAATGEGIIGQLVATGLAGATLLFILDTSQARRRTILIVAVVVVGAMVIATVAALRGHEQRNPYSFVMALLAFLAPVVIVRRLVTAQTITLQTVAGALCLYLLIGLFYSSVYGIVQGLAGAFFVQTEATTPVDFVYFSYITMLTVGYGDFTPAAPFGRMLAVSQAIIGQIFLVGGVAILVSNLGRTRRPEEPPPPRDLVDELRELTADEEESGPSP